MKLEKKCNTMAMDMIVNFFRDIFRPFRKKKRMKMQINAALNKSLETVVSDENPTKKNVENAVKSNCSKSKPKDTSKKTKKSKRGNVSSSVSVEKSSSDSSTVSLASSFSFESDSRQSSEDSMSAAAKMKDMKAVIVDKSCATKNKKTRNKTESQKKTKKSRSNAYVFENESYMQSKAEFDSDTNEKVEQNSDMRDKIYKIDSEELVTNARNNLKSAIKCEKGKSMSKKNIKKQLHLISNGSNRSDMTFDAKEYCEKYAKTIKKGKKRKKQNVVDMKTSTNSDTYKDLFDDEISSTKETGKEKTKDQDDVMVAKNNDVISAEIIAKNKFDSFEINRNISLRMAEYLNKHGNNN